MTILDQLAGYAKERVDRARKELPLEELKKQAVSLTASAEENFASVKRRPPPKG